MNERKNGIYGLLNTSIKKYIRTNSKAVNLSCFCSFFLGLLFALISFPAIAGSMGGMNVPRPWSVSLSLGYTVYEDMYLSDGQTALGRLAIGRDLYIDQALTFGLEMGVQNGNTMRYFPSPEAIDALGGLPIQVTAKPMLDLFLSIRSKPLGQTPIFAQIKGGVAYRHMQFNDRNSINDMSQASGEVIVGFGYSINQQTSLVLSYQGIFGSSPHFRFNADNSTGQISNIPIQNGILFGLITSV